MKKVVFSITNVRSKSDKKLSGFGYLAEGNLLCPCISKNSKPYIRIFNDVEKRCRKIPEHILDFIDLERYGRYCGEEYLQEYSDGLIEIQ